MGGEEEREFHKVWDDHCNNVTAYEAARTCWIEAKRRQKVIELKPEYISRPGYYYKIAATEHELIEAGIQYQIKGE